MEENNNTGIVKKKQVRITPKWRDEAIKYKTLYEDLLSKTTNNSPISKDKSGEKVVIAKPTIKDTGNIPVSKKEETGASNPEPAPVLKSVSNSIPAPTVNKLELKEEPEPKDKEPDKKPENRDVENDGKYFCPACNAPIQVNQEVCECGAVIGWDD